MLIYVCSSPGIGPLVAFDVTEYPEASHPEAGMTARSSVKARAIYGHYPKTLRV